MSTAIATAEHRDMAKRAHGGKREGAGRPQTSERDDVTVRLDRGLVARARYIAEVRGVTLAEYLSAAAKGQVDKDFDAAVKGSSAK